MRRPLTALIGALALLVTALAATAGIGCGRARPQLRHEAQPRRVLHPARGVRQAHPALPEDPGGRRRRASRSRTARPASRPGRSRRASTPTSSHSRSRPTWTSSSPRARSTRSGRSSRTRGWSRTPSSSSSFVTATRRRSRAGTTSFARRRHRHAEPVHLGRRPLEHHGRVRLLEEAGQDRQAGTGEPPQALEERRRPGHERAAPR